jgi:hypothetical protein
VKGKVLIRVNYNKSRAKSMTLMMMISSFSSASTDRDSSSQEIKIFITTLLKSRRIRWARHIVQTEAENSAQFYLTGNCEKKISLGRPSSR